VVDAAKCCKEKLEKMDFIPGVGDPKVGPKGQNLMQSSKQ
jgi:hypothetical protein